MQATTVAAQGSAETDFNLAAFSASLSAEGKTAPAAKTALKRQVDELTSAIDAMRKNLNLEFVKHSVRASSNIQENWEYVKQERKFQGYIATYGYSFHIDDLEKISQVYDALTSIEEATIASPTFALKSRDRINKKSLKDAFAKVSERFETECKVLGLNPSDFEIASWEASYSDSQRSDRVAAHTGRVGAARAMSAAATTYSADVAIESAMGGGAPRGNDEPLELVVGKARVTVNLEVGYARRVSQTIRAKVVKESPLSEEMTHA